MQVLCCASSNVEAKLRNSVGYTTTGLPIVKINHTKYVVDSEYHKNRNRVNAVRLATSRYTEQV